MVIGQASEVTFLQWLVLFQHELLIFAAFWFAVGLVDEFLVDLVWIFLRLTGGARTVRLPRGYGGAELSGPVAVFIPAYDEAVVIGATIRHMLHAWPQRELRLYVGCYRNDAHTLAAAMGASGADPRVRLVVHEAAGPTTKADCLNRLYAALCLDERRSRRPFRGVLLHDAEDMVHPAALQVIDTVLGTHDFVQLPVRPSEQQQSRWIAGHYADEFCESHAKAMVARAALGAPIPAAGVGCGFARPALGALADLRRGAGEAGPFAPECLTEDYELGLVLSRQGRGGTFLRLRDGEGRLVATGSHFPADLGAAVRQKTRWIHGIAFQSWERLGWSARPLELWMTLRDRRGPLAALVLSIAYLLLALDAVLLAGRLVGFPVVPALAQPFGLMAKVSLAGLIWRGAWRVGFTAREYGLAEGARAVLRIPVANVIAIMAGRRALVSYFRALRVGALTWDKTSHATHPALPQLAGMQA